jgi:putative GTP pyrophosphokinase
MPDDPLHVVPVVTMTSEQRTLASAYEQRLRFLGQLKDNLQEKTEQALSRLSHIDRITFRVKDAGSFARKCLPEGQPAVYEHPLIEVEDQIAGRVLVFFSHDLEVVEKRLKDWFRGMVEESRRRPANAAEFGYESDHFVIVIDEHLKPEGWKERSDLPVTFELQIRTLFMHAWAEPQHELGYKGRELSEDQKRLHAWVAASAWGADRAFEDAWDMAKQRGESSDATAQ